MQPTLKSRAKQTAKRTAQRILCHVPPPRGRLSGRLAIHGGSPVRNTKFRPWPAFPTRSAPDWLLHVGPTLRRIFTDGQEGLPQPMAREFEKEWARYCGTKHALLVPHGTDALRIGIAAALNHDGLQHGGEIIVPNISFIASANAALDRRIGIALVDVDRATLNIDPARIEEAIVPGQTKAIMTVHLFGQPADMARVREIAQKHSLTVIEDSAQAHGAIHELGPAGSLGDVAAFSFQSYKNLPSGEGGALTTNDSALYERAYSLHNVGRKLVGGSRWGHETLGWNCRPTEYVAAVLLHRLKSLEAQQQIRWARLQQLHRLLQGFASIECLAFGPGVVRHGVHMFVMRYHKDGCAGLELDDYLKALQAEGIPIGRAYEKTLAQQPAMQSIRAKHPEYVRFSETPIADQAVKELVFLPHNLFLVSESEIEETAAAFRKVESYYTGRATSSFVRSTAATAIAPEPATVTSVQRPAAQLRAGIVGSGFMGLQHAKALAKSGRFKVTAFSDVQPTAAIEAAKQYGAQPFETAEELLSLNQVDVAIIATPHWQHAQLASQALEHGLHVACEKPLTVTVEQADRLIELAAQSQKLFAVVHQTRFEPSYQYVKKLLESRELGAVYRCSLIESAWRTDAYYKSSPWRGTWEGEGGGVLLNQAPHVLDRYAWLCGMPTSVLAKCDTNLHPIEVEDTVSAIFRHENGLHGFLHVNTVECPPTSEMVICCDRGRISIDRGRVRVTRLATSIHDATRRDPRPWGELGSETQELEFGFGDALDSLLVAFYDNLAEAAEGRAALVCPGKEGRDAVELANAIVLSSAEKRELELPIDRTAYTSFIESKLGLAGAAAAK